MGLFPCAGRAAWWASAFLVAVLFLQASHVIGIPSAPVLGAIASVNAQGPYLGIVVPNSYELQPILDPSVYTASTAQAYIDVLGRRFYIGEIETHKVIIVMTGLSMLNAGITTELLLSFFNISGVLHYGIAGNANDELNIGDITIPKYWAHTGLWNWQMYAKIRSMMLFSHKESVTTNLTPLELTPPYPPSQVCAASLIMEKLMMVVPKKAWTFSCCKGKRVLDFKRGFR